MILNRKNAQISFLIEKVKNILLKYGPLEAKQLLVHLLGTPDISECRTAVGEEQFRELLNETAYRLLQLRLIRPELSFDLDDINGKTVYCLPGQILPQTKVNIARVTRTPSPL